MSLIERIYLFSLCLVNLTIILHQELLPTVVCIFATELQKVKGKFIQKVSCYVNSEERRKETRLNKIFLNYYIAIHIL